MKLPGSIRILKVAALLVLSILSMLLFLNQVDATAFEKATWSQLDFYADHSHDPITPTLTVNHTLGLPGSYFIITGEDHPAYNCYRVEVNNHLVSPTPVCADEAGSFVFELSTPSTEEGSYRVTVSVEGQSGTTAAFKTDTDASTQWPAQGLADSFDIPQGIGNLVYLPLVIRNTGAE